MMCSSQPPECDSEFNSIGSVPGSVPSEIVRKAETVFQSLSSELRLHNSCLPIAKLPNELLINIIHRSLYGLEKEYFIRLWSLSQVSTLWYDLVKHSPTLWGYTHSEHTTTEVELALRRSKGALIDVVYVHKGDEPYLEAVLKERSRWRSVRFKIRHETRSTDLLGYLSQGIFEHLEEVDLTYLPIGWYPLLLDNPIGPHMPRLRHLRLSDITVAWDSDIPSNLDTLSLIFVDWGSGPSTKQVMGILHASPSLTSLQLRCYEMPPGAPYSPTTISLPRLHTLDLDLPVWKAGQLFTSLDIPFCRRFNLHFVAERPEEFYSVGCKILSSMLTSATGIHLDISSWKITFKWRTTSEDAGFWPFELTINWPRDIPLDLSTMPPVVHLVIDEERPWPIHQMTALLSTLSSVTSFTFKSPHPRDLILNLSVPQSSSPKGWLLPRLQSLEISVVSTGRDLLLGMVQGRHDGVDLNGIVDGDVALPLRLKSVAVTSYGWKDADLAYLQEKVAEVDWSIVM